MALVVAPISTIWLSRMPALGSLSQPILRRICSRKAVGWKQERSASGLLEHRSEELLACYQRHQHRRPPIKAMRTAARVTSS